MSHGSHAAHEHDHSHCSGSHHAHAASSTHASDANAAVAPGHVRTAIRIEQMDCPTEEGLIRKKLRGAEGISALSFNVVQRTMTIDHAPDRLEAALAAIRSLGFAPQIATAADPAVTAPARSWWPLGLAGALAVCAEALHFTAQPEWMAAGVALAAILIGGLGTYKKGWIAVRNGDLNINALMSIAVTGAVFLGQWAEAAMVMVLFSVAEAIEARSLDRARHAITGLMRLSPDTVEVRQPDGLWADSPVKDVALDSLVRVKPGARIGLDGTVTAGISTVDQAPMTGESVPVDKQVGDSVFAGTINGAGALEYRVTAAASQTTLSRIIRAVQDAQGARAPTQRFVDKFARVYTPVVLFIALGVAVFAPLFLGAAWQPWIYKALVLLVIACPCALVISTPVTIVSGLAAAARIGILIKGGQYLEQGRQLKWLALDKTGTLTQGRPVQTAFEVVSDHDAARVQAVALALASQSDHPVSMAVARAARHQTALRVDGFQAIPGAGVKGVVDGSTYHLGNRSLLQHVSDTDRAIVDRADTLERAGNTVVVLMDAERVLALIAVADTLKPTSAQAIQALHALGIKTVILSGDNAHVVAAVAKDAGIDDSRGNQLPQDKLDHIVSLSESGPVGMVGDGINDAPALARADIGFAMGAMGSDTAIETADVALMDDDLRKIPQFVLLSRRTHALLVQNIALAIGIKLVFLALTIAGFGTMWMAVFADVGASLLVVANGLRLLRIPATEREAIST